MSDRRRFFFGSISTRGSSTGVRQEWDEATAMVAIATVASFRRGLDIEHDGVFPFFFDESTFFSA